MSARELGLKWYDLFSRHAEDLYPGRYTIPRCLKLANQKAEIDELANEKQSTIVAHNYLYPEFHESADKVGDSLGLSLFIRDIGAKRVDFESVAFMGQTAKMITGDATRIFIPDYPEVIGCSLVFGTSYEWIEEWKKENDGIIITYINSDPYTKSLSDYIGTSSNFDKIIVHAAQEHPGKKILLLPDKFLSYVMKSKAMEQGVPADLIEVYEFKKQIEENNPPLNIYSSGENHWNASCVVHDKEGIPSDMMEVALVENPGAELMVHPECGCASSCLLKIQKHELPDTKVYFCSTEGMVRHARNSAAKLFLVATEKGLVYRLRKELPDKKFIPVSYKASCPFMKQNTFEKLLESLRKDRLELILCDDCCDPKKPYRDDRVIHIQKSVAQRANRGINRMLEIR